MWQNIIIFFIIVACLFFIGRRIRSQLKGSKSGCGCSGGCGGSRRENKGLRDQEATLLAIANERFPGGDALDLSQGILP